MAAVRLNFCERRPSAAEEEREAEHEQQVPDDAAGNRRLDQFDVSLAERDDRDDELGGVAERGVEEAAQCGAGAFGEFLGSEPNHAGQWDQ